jgi:hypothetical protein
MAVALAAATLQLIMRPSLDPVISRAGFPATRLALICALALFGSFVGCSYFQPVDTAPLDAAGMNYSAIKQLKELRISTAEVAEMARVRQSGFSDSSCVALLQIYRDQKKPFADGEAVATLFQSGLAESTVLEIARMGQLGPSSGELVAIRLVGLPDSVVLAVARRRSAGAPVLSGASLGKLKNTGMRAQTLAVLIDRGVPDSQTGAILSERRRGLSDAEILRHFSGT